MPSFRFRRASLALVCVLATLVACRQIPAIEAEAVAAAPLVGPESREAAQAPSEYLDYLSSRVAARIFSCSDLPVLEAQACLMFTATFSLIQNHGYSYFRFSMAIEALNAAQTAVSTGRYRRRVAIQPIALPNGATEALELGYGDEESRRAVFVALLKRVGFEVRAVNLRCPGGSVKVGAEVRLGLLRALERWRFFDLSKGSFYTLEGGHLQSLLSLADLRRGAPFLEVGNDAELSRFVQSGADEDASCFTFLSHVSYPKDELATFR